MSKQGSMFSHLSVKNAITFSTIWTVFYSKQDGLHIQSPESQLHIVTHDSWSTKKRLVLALPSFLVTGDKGHFRKCLTQYFEFSCCSRSHALISWTF